MKRHIYSFAGEVYFFEKPSVFISGLKLIISQTASCMQTGQFPNASHESFGESPIDHS